MESLFLAILSAIILGVYDLFKKKSLHNNAVIPVLFFSTLTSALIFTPVFIYGVFVNHNENSILNFMPINFHTHFLFFMKSLLITMSWFFAYFAMKHLPLTIASPIRSSGPLWTIFGALFIFGENINITQMIGVFVTLFFYYIFSISGSKEGISFRTNKWVMFMIASTILSSISALYDKYLLSYYNRLLMQSLFHIYMVPLMLILLLFLWYPKRKKYTKFEWRYTIPLIGITLSIADFLYFWSLSYPDSLIAIISTIRRGSVVISFTLGGIILKEKNIRQKAFILSGILIGILIILIGK